MHSISVWPDYKTRFPLRIKAYALSLNRNGNAWVILRNGIGDFMTEQNRKYIMKEIGRLLSEIWRIKGLSEQEYGPQHPITKKLGSMHEEAQALLQEKP
jgi:hypothetical protein